MSLTVPGRILNEYPCAITGLVWLSRRNPLASFP
jgi:hypothetical protein